MFLQRLTFLAAALAATARAQNIKTNLIQLIPFRVQITLDGLAADVNDDVVDRAVTEWMTESFQKKSIADNMAADGISFGLVDLTRSADQGQQPGSSVYRAGYSGTSLWQRSGEDYNVRIEQEKIDLIQRFTFIEGRELEILLMAEDEDTGLGDAVIDASAFISPDDSNGDNDADNGGDDNNDNDNDNDNESTDSNADGSSGGGDDNSNKNLEIIIIAAIIVACVAFCLLTFAVCWAWKTDRDRRGEDSVASSSERKQPQHADNQQQMRSTPDGTGSESDYDPESPSPKATSPDAKGYSDSVISDDISTSLTAYYRSGMSSYNMPRNQRGGAASHGDDAASMSSMDSYGYSLDGYAPSLSGGPTQMGYPVESPEVIEDDHPAGRR